MMYKVCGDQGCFGSDSVSCGPGRDRGRRQRHQLLDQRRRQPVRRCRRARLPRCLQRGRLRGGVGRQLRSGRRDHRPSRPVGRPRSAPARRTARSSTTSTSRQPDGAALSLPGVSLTAGVGPRSPRRRQLATASARRRPRPARTPARSSSASAVFRAGRAEKGFNVLQGGAVGMVLYNNSAGVTDQETDNHWLPASHIQFSQGTALLALHGRQHRRHVPR